MRYQIIKSNPSWFTSSKDWPVEAIYSQHRTLEAAREQFFKTPLQIAKGVWDTVKQTWIY